VQIDRVGHVSFTIGDLDHSVEFYARFGYEQVSRTQVRGIAPQPDGPPKDVDVDLAWLRRSAGDPMLELVCYTDQPIERARINSRVGAAHLCFVVSDLQSAVAELRADGVTFVSEPRRDQFGTHWVYLHDPDGNTLELLQDPPAETH
jgi:catechol 2,3-dioxygenase-like lactoylglutathione lyase family enzyme